MIATVHWVLKEVLLQKERDAQLLHINIYVFTVYIVNWLTNLLFHPYTVLDKMTASKRILDNDEKISS